DGGFSRCDHEHKKYENLAADLMTLARECDKSQVDRVQHDFYREEQRDDVSFDKKTEHADQEEDRAEDQKPVQRDHSSFFANTIAPIKAIRINRDVASKGST